MEYRYLNWIPAAISGCIGVYRDIDVQLTATRLEKHWRSVDDEVVYCSC
jgi:hypothetical protein